MTDHNNLYNILNKINKLTPQEPAKPVTESKQKTVLESTMEEVLSEKYMGFKKVEKAIAKNPDVKNPGAVAAAIGREKYGKKAFQKAAAAGKKMGEDKNDDAKVDAINAAHPPKAPSGKSNRFTPTPVKHNTYDRKAVASHTQGSDKAAYDQLTGRKGEMEEGIDHTSVAHNLAKLARVIKSVQTPEQFAVARKYARRMSGTIMKHQHDNSGFGSGLRANLAVMRDIHADLKAKADELGIEFDPLAEGFPTVADAKKQAEKERGTGKFDKKTISTGTVYSRKYDPKSGESEDDGKDGEGKAVEKRGRGRPKKSTFESHKTINRMVDDVFEDIMGEGDEEQLSYEQEQLKSHIGAHMYKQLENTMKTGDDFNDNLFDVLYDYYKDEMPYGVAKARTGDPTEWLHTKMQSVFPPLDEGRLEGGVFVDKPGNVPVPTDPEGVPARPTFKPGLKPAEPARATVAPADAKKFMQSSDPQIFNKLTGTSPAGKATTAVSDPEGVKEDSLASMLKLAGMQVNESKADKKADDDYDNDGKIETGKEEYLGSKIAAAKKAGKLKESTCKSCHKDPCICKEEKCMECGMYEDKCSCTKQVDECMSPMGNGMGEEQEGKMNINTSMDSDGHKSVTITADGNSALELMQMLKLAGLGGGDVPQEEPEGVMVVTTGDEEEIDEEKVEEGGWDIDDPNVAAKQTALNQQVQGATTPAAPAAPAAGINRLTGKPLAPAAPEKDPYAVSTTPKTPAPTTPTPLQQNYQANPNVRGIGAPQTPAGNAELDEGGWDIDDPNVAAKQTALNQQVQGAAAPAAGINRLTGKPLAPAAPEKDPYAVSTTPKTPAPTTPTPLQQNYQSNPNVRGIGAPQTTAVDEDSRYEANTTPEEHIYGVQKMTKGGDGDFGEKKMHSKRPTWKNADNAMAESISLKMMKEYEGIKIKK